MFKILPGILIPADLPSKGCSIKQLLESTWWQGPYWLYNYENWNQTEFCFNNDEVDHELKKQARKNEL